METNKLPTLIVLCGIQGSGKSIEGIELLKQMKVGSQLISSDSYRATFPTYENDKIFKLVYEHMNDVLKEGNDVIIDSTNTTLKMRRKLVDAIKYPCIKKCFILNTSYEKCLRRVMDRNKKPNEHQVSIDAIQLYLYNFEIPFYEEGWDDIQLLYHNFSQVDSLYYKTVVLNKCDSFDQKNKYHNQNLGQHMKTVASYLENKTDNINMKNAAVLHDIGKLATQTFKEGDFNAHYYNHANVGTYDLMCNCGIFDMDYGTFQNNATLEMLFYVNYHMHPHNWQTEKSKIKWRKIFGEEKYNNLLLFNEADKFRIDTKEGN